MSEANSKTSRKLSETQQQAIEAAQRWVDESASSLGMAYLEFKEAERRFRLAEEKLSSYAIATRDSEMQRNQVMVKFAEVLELGPGEWVYDGKGNLVRKDTSNAESS